MYDKTKTYKLLNDITSPDDGVIATSGEKVYISTDPEDVDIYIAETIDGRVSFPVQMDELGAS